MVFGFKFGFLRFKSKKHEKALEKSEGKKPAWNERKTMVATIGLLVIISVYIAIKYFQGAFP
jgi:hypothetical protein